MPQGGHISLDVTPRPIPLIKPISLAVEVRGLRPRKVEVDMGTVDIYMGVNRRKLKPAGYNRYTTEAMLGACTSDTMHWRFTVRVRDGRTTYSAPFEFVTRIPGLAAPL